MATACPDLAVGAPLLLPNRWGEIYSFSGKTGGQLWVFREPPYPIKQALASLGEFIAPVGDLDGDGRHDLLVAAPFHDNTGAATLPGRKGLCTLRCERDGHPLASGGVPAQQRFVRRCLESGSATRTATVSRTTIGHRGTDELLLFSGTSGALLRSIPSPADAGTGLIAFARAGERDGDAKEDFSVGIPESKRASLLNGQGSELLTLTDPGAAPSSSLQGFASRLARVADLNDDGKSELLVASPGKTRAAKRRLAWCFS